MSNKEISKVFKLAGQLLELHGENPFKVRSFQNAAFRVERLQQPVESLTAEEIERIDGIGKSIAGKISEIKERQSFTELDELLGKTPRGVIEMLGVKGIGPKKVHALWKELGIESTGELLYACNENRLVELKGFGARTQEQIRQAIEYRQSNAGKFHYAPVETIALQLLDDIRKSGLTTEVSFTGALRRKCEILEKAEFITTVKEHQKFLEFLSNYPLMEKDSLREEGNRITVLLAGQLPVEILVCGEIEFVRNLFITTGHPDHLEILRHEFGYNDSTLAVESEKEIYTSLKLPFVEPELREGLFESDWLKNNSLPELIDFKDLRGILHNHTTFSDGANTLEQMATACKDAGYEYLGICDHSKSAFYANGLQPERILLQHSEIDALNKKLAPFHIFKGIESDILSDGSLDYPDEILASFDFIVASVHSVLRMDKDRATERIIKAVENRYTTILGHPTGRLLLAREGYPIDHHKVIDACAANGVVIELNANPYRLDLDWRFIPYALNKNVKISINPDAHRIEGYHDMYYGVCVARKGGLIREMTFNARGLGDVTRHFQSRK